VSVFSSWPPRFEKLAGELMLSSQGTGLFASLGADRIEAGTAAEYLSEVPSATGPRSGHRSLDSGGLGAEQLRSSVLEIRRLTGFTWKLMALLLKVSRRSVYKWLEGQPASSDHQVHVQRILATLRQIDRGDSKLNRELLLTPGGDRGRLLLDLLVFEQYDRVASIAGKEGPAIWPEPEISCGDFGSMPPPPPLSLIDALHDDPTISEARCIPEMSFPVPNQKA